MSMELINRRKAISHITACDGKSAQIEALENMPTVKAIPIEVIEQIRVEISKMQTYLCHHGDTKKVELSEVLEAIDKALKEQSE